MAGCVRAWAPQATLVTFKLETDPLLLRGKAAAALAPMAEGGCGAHAVVGNLLHTRYEEVVLLGRVPPVGGCPRMGLSEGDVRAGVVEGGGGEEVIRGRQLESLLACRLVGVHGVGREAARQTV